MKKQDSFFLKGECKYPGYRNVRDLPHCAEYRGFVEDLWKDYKPYADRHFLIEAKNNFQERFWEMYVCVAFLRRGFLVTKVGEDGPEFFVEIGGKKVWIEAVAPGPGIGQNQIAEPPMGDVSDVPSEKIILRYTSALSYKLKKYLEYRRKEIVGENDCYVIAINSKKIPYASLGFTLPYHVHAFLPFGNLTVSISRETRDRETFFQYRGFLRNNGGVKVSTKPFLEPAYAGISAVIHSGVDCANGPSELGADFDILHNPLAKNALLIDDLKWCRHRFYNNGELSTEEPK